MKVLVIGGGISDEREVSLRSAHAIYDAAKKAGYEASFYDWDGSNDWLAENGRIFDVVLPILHGKGGEDGLIQAIFEAHAIPYLGSSSQVAKQCFDKQMAKAFVQQLGFRVPKGELLSYKQYMKSFFRRSSHVIKPVMAGSSIHTHIVHDASSYDKAKIKNTFDFYNTVLVEECIIGQEITVGYLDGIELPVVEIIPPAGEFFDYENKYNGRTVELCPPENISENVQKQAIETTRQVHTKLGCRFLSRSDFMVKNDEIYFLEINTMPGMTDQSLFPRAARAAGLDFPELVDYFIKLVKG